jgi:phosphatidylserine/phosphatidylglycerophosphate/cardiolipin synthase-like enzyme
MADQAFNRTAGAPLIGGNAVRVLRDAAENYPAWEEAIRQARHTIHVEMYIIHADRTGRRFMDLLAAKARSGVQVRLLYDWFGCGWSRVRGLFRPLVLAGGDVRVFNPPTLGAVMGWVRRNHRKLLTIDGEVAYIGGLCIGEAWEGVPARGREPWRDTAVEIRGPAVAHADAAFAESWAVAGGTPFDALPAAEPCGDTALRVVPTEPFTANLFRIDLLVAALARERLWITDAYFIGHGPFAEALMHAARDGVDVRLLLPHGSDVGWTVPVSRTLYRTLLEAGIRVYEWTGTMIHAKTAVADSRWARVGSTNLNINSWLGNWELDVTIEDTDVAATMEAHFLEDLERSAEITLDARGRLMQTRVRPPRGRARRSARRVVREVTGAARSLSAAVTGSRPLEPYEIAPLLALTVFLAALAAVGFMQPQILAWPVATLAAWLGLTLLVDAWRAVMRWRRQ